MAMPNLGAQVTANYHTDPQVYQVCNCEHFHITGTSKQAVHCHF